VICFADLRERADLDDATDRTRDVEALIENPECGHVFHKSCLVSWLARADVEDDNVQNCPVCKNRIAIEVVNRLRAEGAPLAAEEGGHQLTMNELRAVIMSYDDEEEEDGAGDDVVVAPTLIR